MTKQVKIYAGSDTYEKWQQICNQFSSNTAAFAAVVENYFNEIKEDTMSVYIYCTDVYGNPGPYATTREQLLKDLREMGYTGELTEGQWGHLYDDDGEKVAELATDDVIACYYQIDDPLGLLKK